MPKLHQSGRGHGVTGKDNGLKNLARLLPLMLTACSFDQALHAVPEPVHEPIPATPVTLPDPQPWPAYITPEPAHVIHPEFQ